MTRLGSSAAGVVRTARAEDETGPARQHHQDVDLAGVDAGVVRISSATSTADPQSTQAVQAP